MIMLSAGRVSSLVDPNSRGVIPLEAAYSSSSSSESSSSSLGVSDPTCPGVSTLTTEVAGRSRGTGRELTGRDGVSDGLLLRFFPETGGLLVEEAVFLLAPKIAPKAPPRGR